MKNRHTPVCPCVHDTRKKVNQAYSIFGVDNLYHQLFLQLGVALGYQATSMRNSHQGCTAAWQEDNEQLISSVLDNVWHLASYITLEIMPGKGVEVYESSRMHTFSWLGDCRQAAGCNNPATTLLSPLRCCWCWWRCSGCCQAVLSSSWSQTFFPTAVQPDLGHVMACPLRPLEEESPDLPNPGIPLT